MVAAAALAALASAASAGNAGSFDRSFANDGRKLTDFFNRIDRASAIAIQSDGRIVVAGRAGRFPEADRLALARYERDGRLDRSFGGDGRRSLPCSGPAALAVQANGKILVAGSCSDIAVARLRRNGRLDRTFGRGGIVRTDVGGLAHANDIAIQTDGRIVVAGETHAAGGGQNYLIVVRYRRPGILDEGFADEGVVKTRFGTPADALGYGLAIQDDGKLVVSGEVGNNWIVARLLSDGSLDPSFDEDGVNFSAPKLIGEARDVQIQPDGRIVTAGRDFGASVVRFAVARYLPNGSFDESFGDDGAQHTVFGRRRPADAYSLALQADGKIVVVGRGSDGRDTRIALARYRASGQLDRRFGERGRVTAGFPQQGRSHDDGGRAVAIQRNGRIVVAGFSQPHRMDDDFAIARFLASAG